MFTSKWFASLLRGRNRRLQKQLAVRKHLRNYTQSMQVEVLEDRTLLSNVAPTLVTLQNQVQIVSDDTTSQTKIADIVVVDDGLGTNDLSLSGADADLFEIIGTELYLIENPGLDASVDTQLDVTIEVDDSSVGGSPDATYDFSMIVSPALTTEHITGTSGADDIVFSINGQSATLSVNDVKTYYNLNQYDTFVFDGLGSTDTITINSTSDDLNNSFLAESGILDGKTILLEGYNFRLSAHDFEEIILHSDSGFLFNEADQIWLKDSIGSDILTVGHDTIGEYTSLVGTGFSHKVYDAHNIAVTSFNGGVDRAYLYDKQGEVDTVEMSVTTTTMSRGNYIKAAYDFDTVYAYSQAGESDEAIITDTFTDDTFYMWHDETSLDALGVSLKVFDFSSVTANSTSGGNDLVYMYDSSGDDELTMNSESAVLSGDGFNNQANGFEQVKAYAINGGEDTLIMSDTAGDDVVVMNRQSLTLSGIGFSNEAIGFENAQVTSTAGDDKVIMNGTYQDDTFISRYLQDDQMTFATMEGDDYKNTAYNFNTIEAVTSGAGFDKAELYDTRNVDDLALISINSVSISPTAGSGVSYTSSASGFDRAYVISEEEEGGGDDEAIITDSAGNDLVVMRDTQSRISSGAVIAYANNFSTVIANATEGGSDRVYHYDSEEDEQVTIGAFSSLVNGETFTTESNGFEKISAYGMYADGDTVTMEDSSDDDVFDLKPGIAYMRGPGYLNCVFDNYGTLVVEGDNGGTDIAHLHDTEGDDILTIDPTTAVLTTPEETITVNNFEIAYGYSSNGGNDKATMTDADTDDSYIARPTYSYMRADDLYIYAVGYNDITVNATQGGFNQATLRGKSGEVDKLSSTPTTSVLERDGYSNTVNGFQRVYAYANPTDGDMATLTGASQAQAQDDLLVINPGYTYQETNGARTYAIDFDEVHAYANGGTNDNAQGNASDEDDLFLEMGSYGQLQYNVSGTNVANTQQQTVFMHDYNSVKLYGGDVTEDEVQKVIPLDAAFKFDYLSQGFDWMYNETPTLSTPSIAGTTTLVSENPFSNLIVTDARRTPEQGVFSDLIFIELVDPGDASQALSLEITEDTDTGNQTITINLATDENGEITSTASEIAALINTDAAASLLISAGTDAPGTGVVSAIALTQLANGTNGTFV